MTSPMKAGKSAAPAALRILASPPWTIPESRIAIAIAILLSGIVQGGEANIRSAAGAALFPAFIGLVIVWRSILKRQGG